MPYECGIAPTGDARHRFSVKFYLVAMLFILFDIEAIFLYPWAVVYKQLKMFAFLEMLMFVILILAGFFFIWKKGVLDWAHSDVTCAALRSVIDSLRSNAARGAGAQMIPETSARQSAGGGAGRSRDRRQIRLRRTDDRSRRRRISSTRCGALKNDLKFERLSTVTAVDRYPAEPRFEVVYHLQSIAAKSGCG